MPFEEHDSDGLTVRVVEEGGPFRREGVLGNFREFELGLDRCTIQDLQLGESSRNLAARGQEGREEGGGGEGSPMHKGQEVPSVVGLGGNGVAGEDELAELRYALQEVQLGELPHFVV